MGNCNRLQVPPPKKKRGRPTKRNLPGDITRPHWETIYRSTALWLYSCKQEVADENIRTPWHCDGRTISRSDSHQAVNSLYETIKKLLAHLPCMITGCRISCHGHCNPSPTHSKQKVSQSWSKWIALGHCCKLVTHGQVTNYQWYVQLCWRPVCKWYL